MPASIDSLIDVVDALCNYEVNKALYESECAIKAKLAEYRKAIYEASVQKQRVATVELARCKYRMTQLSNRFNALPENQKTLMAPLLKPLLEELDNRIAELRNQRKLAR